MSGLRARTPDERCPLHGEFTLTDAASALIGGSVGDAGRVEREKENVDRDQGGALEGGPR
jgi:hypothetical protein